jgi:maltose O-acetyltransferase
MEMKVVEKLQRIGREEMNYDLRKLAVRAFSSGLPQHGFNRLRTRLLIRAGLHIAPRASIAGPVRITGPGPLGALLSIGPGSFISGPIHIDLGAAVSIGARVYIGDQVKLLTGTHEIGESNQRCGGHRWAPIEIGDGAWIGSGVTVLPGVRIGGGAVVGAGAVVTADVAPDTLVAGVPARFVRDLDPEGATASRGPQSGMRIKVAAVPSVRAAGTR